MCLCVYAFVCFVSVLIAPACAFELLLHLWCLFNPLLKIKWTVLPFTCLSILLLKKCCSSQLLFASVCVWESMCVKVWKRVRKWLAYSFGNCSDLCQDWWNFMFQCAVGSFFSPQPGSEKQRNQEPFGFIKELSRNVGLGWCLDFCWATPGLVFFVFSLIEFLHFSLWFLDVEGQK